MRIRTRLKIHSIGSLAVILLIVGTIFSSVLQLDKATEQDKTVALLVKGMAELEALTYDYLLHHEKRAKKQWRTRYDSLESILKSQKFAEPEEQSIFEKIYNNLENINKTFTRLVSILETSQILDNNQENAFEELEGRLINRISLESRETVTNAFILGMKVRSRIMAIEHLKHILIITLSIVFFLVVTISSFSVMNAIAKPIDKLEKGVEIIGTGNLDYKVGTAKMDEIGQLSRAFDKMTGDLKLITASRDQLDKEIFERQRAEEELKKVLNSMEIRVQERTADLEKANAELAEYASVVSHDIRSPLRAIHNYADFLREDLAATLDGDQKSYLDGLGTAVRQAEELITDLLELARVGRRAIVAETIDMGTFLQELIESMQFPEAVEIKMAEEWPTIEMEPILLRQVFQNIIENAVKFNLSSPKKVELGWSLVADGEYEFFVTDNGIGIEPRFHEQIFKVFERLYVQKEYEGSGIGLAIVKKAIDKLHGSVRVESKTGKGSTFFVLLPGTQ